VSRSPEQGERPDPLQIDSAARRLHELRQPLAAILAAATALQAGVAPDNETERKFFSIIIENANRLGEMLEADATPR